MAQLTPSTQPAARPFSPAQGSKTAEHASASPAQAFAGQLDQALADAADNQPAAASPLAGSAQTVPDPAASALAANPASPPQSPALLAPAPSAATASRLPLASPGLLGRGAATRTAGNAKSEAGNGEAVAPSSCLTPLPQPVSPADPATAQPPTPPDSITPPPPAASAKTSAAETTDTGPTLSTASSTMIGATAGTGTSPLAPREQAERTAPASPAADGSAVLSPRAKQPRPATLTLAGAAETTDPANRPTEEQTALAGSSTAQALADAGPKLSPIQTTVAPVSRNPRAEPASSGEIVDEPRDGHASAPGQPQRSDDLPPASKPLASPAGLDGPAAPAPAATSTASALTSHPLLVPAPPGNGASAQTPAVSTPPSPAAQVAEAVREPVQVTLTTSPQSTDAAQTLTIHLKPDELGRVEIRIERPTDGPARIELAVERPETLLRLVHDQPQLQQALDQAGISPAGRTIHFTLAADASSGNGFGASGSGASASGDSAPGGSGQRFQHGYRGHASRSSDETDLPITATAWARAGLDITA